MSDLSLLAAAFAQLTAADQPNPNKPEPPAIAGLSDQTKHQAVHPIALALHQASIDTYQAEFSRAPEIASATAVPFPRNTPLPASSPPAASIQVIPAAAAQPTPAIQISQPQALATRTIAAPGEVNLAKALHQLLPAPAQLSLRPLITHQGGSISALPTKVRPIALKLHQASIETYANTLALMPLSGQDAIAEKAKAQTVAMANAQPASGLSTAQRSASQPKATSPASATVSLSPAAIALGMAQAAGAAQSIADAGRPNPAAQLASQLTPQATEAQAEPKIGAAQKDGLKAESLLASPPVVVTSKSDSQPEKLSAAQAAIALDRQVRSELASESITVAPAQSPTQIPIPAPQSAQPPVQQPPVQQPAPAQSEEQATTLDSPLWASSGTARPAPPAPTPTIQLSREAVAQANAIPGSQTVPEPSMTLPPGTIHSSAISPSTVNPGTVNPGAKQAIAAAPLATRSSPRPSLSPLQLPSPLHRANGPRSGPQLYQQRLAALKQGRLYSRLPIDSFKAIWQGVRHKPSYGQWQRLLAAEARAVGGGQGNNRLSIVLGDSISLWLPMQQLPNSQIWLNQGISGDTTAGILKRLEPLKATRPSNIYLMAGVNDLKNGATDDQVAQNLQQIISQLRQQHPQAQIHVQSILPANLGLPPGRIQNLNARIARIAHTEQVAFLNIYPQFAAPNGQMMAQLTTDGIHLSPQGYALWQSILHRLAEPWAFANQGGLLGRS